MSSLIDYYNTGDNDVFDIGPSTDRAGQIFTASSNYYISSVKLLLYRIGSPGTITVELQSVSNNFPSNTILISGTTDGDTLTTNSSGEWREITFSSSYLLISGTQYAVVIRDNGDVFNGAQWRIDDSSPTYSGGSLVNSIDSGTNWGYPFGGGIDSRDCMFETYGVNYLDFSANEANFVTYRRLVIATNNNKIFYENL